MDLLQEEAEGNDVCPMKLTNASSGVRVCRLGCMGRLLGDDVGPVRLSSINVLF